MLSSDPQSRIALMLCESVLHVLVVKSGHCWINGLGLW
jgi:hypothetical protein